jgi:hypothetical protein
MWSSSIVPLECCACVSVTLTPPRSTVPPLFGSRILSSGTTFFIQVSQSASSTGATTMGLCFSTRSNVFPTWSSWPWVIAMTSTRSGSFSLSGIFGFVSQGST